MSTEGAGPPAEGAVLPQIALSHRGPACPILSPMPALSRSGNTPLPVWPSFSLISGGNAAPALDTRPDLHPTRRRRPQTGLEPAHFRPVVTPSRPAACFCRIPEATAISSDAYSGQMTRRIGEAAVRAGSGPGLAGLSWHETAYRASLVRPGTGADQHVCALIASTERVLRLM